MNLCTFILMSTMFVNIGLIAGSLDVSESQPNTPHALPSMPHIKPQKTRERNSNHFVVKKSLPCTPIMKTCIVHDSSEYQEEECQSEREHCSRCPVSKLHARYEKPENCDEDGALDFEVENKTGRAIFVTCFSYLRQRDFGRWRWDKSPVYKVDDDASVVVNISDVSNPQDREHVYGYLGVFRTQKAAEDATYELTSDKKLLDLDLLYKLKDKKVTIEVEKYGIKGEFYEYDFVRKDDIQSDVPLLDFPVKNDTGKPIFVICFVYQKKAKGRWMETMEEKDDMSVWRFDKTPIIKLMPQETGMIEVDKILGSRDRTYVRGYLAIFDEDEEKLAQDATYELLESRHKLHLGDLDRLKNSTVVINVEMYGIKENFVDFTIKPTRVIDFKKVSRGQRQFDHEK